MTKNKLTVKFNYMKTIKLISLLLIIITCLTASAEPRESEKGKIDWIKGVIISEGRYSLSIDDKGDSIDEETGSKTSISFSRDQSYEKAKEKAIYGAALAVNDVLIDPDTRIKDLILRDTEVRQKISHHLHEYSRFKEKPSGYLSSTCELELRLSYLLNVLNIAFPEDEFPTRNDNEIHTKYTSLIIDTRGLKIKPMLLPSIMNENGLEVYSRNQISGQAAVKNLAVSYTLSEKEAIKHKKAGSHPFFCTALKSLNGNPVLSDEDIKRIFSHKENFTFLKKCKVLFIIDR